MVRKNAVFGFPQTGYDNSPFVAVRETVMGKEGKLTADSAAGFQLIQSSPGSYTTLVSVGLDLEG